MWASFGVGGEALQRGEKRDQGALVAIRQIFPEAMSLVLPQGQTVAVHFS